MKSIKVHTLITLIILLLMALSNQGLVASATPSLAYPAQTTGNNSSVGGPIIADHLAVTKYSSIPQAYINAVKKMWVTIPGESHSEAYRRGSELLEAQDNRFQVNVTESGTPEGYTDQHLRISRATWGDLDYASGWIYDYGEEDWYTSNAARLRTQSGITYANTHGLTIAAMGFGWCWDMSWLNDPGGTLDPQYQVHWAGSSVGGPQGDLRWGLDDGDTALTGNSINMNTYISAMEQYIAFSEVNAYPTQVFFTTGPVEDLFYNTGENGYQAYLKQEYIRNYVLRTANRILFDYADILTWGDNGSKNTTSWTDYGGTPHTYPYIHPDNLLVIGGTQTSDVGHIGERGALRLSKAFWWMLARLAGWDGVTGSYRSSVASGNWDVPSNWGGALLPSASDGITITAGTIITVNVNAQVTALTIEQGAKLIIPAGITLDVSEQFVNHGTVKITRPVSANASVDFQIGDTSRGITRYRMVSLTSPNDLGNVTVTVRALNAGETCTSGTASSYARRCFEITPTYVDRAATLRLWAFQNEMNGVTGPKIFRNTSSGWSPLANSVSATQGSYTYVEAQTPGFSSFLISGADGPTAIEILNLRGRVTTKIPLHWLGGVLCLAAVGIWLISRRAH